MACWVARATTHNQCSETESGKSVRNNRCSSHLIWGERGLYLISTWERESTLYLIILPWSETKHHLCFYLGAFDMTCCASIHWLTLFLEVLFMLLFLLHQFVHSRWKGPKWTLHMDTYCRICEKPTGPWRAPTECRAEMDQAIWELFLARGLDARCRSRQHFHLTWSTHLFTVKKSCLSVNHPVLTMLISSIWLVSTLRHAW